jgi:hypothetical protein
MFQMEFDEETQHLIIRRNGETLDSNIPAHLKRIREIMRRATGPLNMDEPDETD